MKKFSIIFVLTLMAILVITPPAAANGTTGSIVRISGNIVVAADEVVHGDVVSIMGNVEVYGTVYGNVVTVLGNTTVGANGRIVGDTVAVLGNLDAHKDSSISGSTVNIVGSGDLGDVDFPGMIIQSFSRNVFKLNLARKIIKLITTVLLATVIVALFPIVTERIKKCVQANPGKSALVGLLAWVAIVPIITITALTIIGIPLAVLMGAAVWVAGRLGEAALVLLIGRAILKDTQSEPAVAAFGALLLGVTVMIPLVGALVGLAVGLITIGAVTLTRFGTVEATA